MYDCKLAAYTILAMSQSDVCPKGSDFFVEPEGLLLNREHLVAPAWEVQQFWH